MRQTAARNRGVATGEKWSRRRPRKMAVDFARVTRLVCLTIFDELIIFPDMCFGVPSIIPVAGESLQVQVVGSIQIARFAISMKDKDLRHE